ncbi:CDP-alcohol phosphatidyltransferase family protein [Saccharospirillum mangrovi]|uniref:CDP-alcohol phosphatidyltransferase family protein n=1 Tax=Saccharospirillum mangrovi TaxID=2161747 RepID=UPI000D3A5B2E|nr:CDP-alcohol phosphatidyltransferase family protein [Saccharospirillum mangrovi]
MPGLTERFVTVFSARVPSPLHREWVRIAFLGAGGLLVGALVLWVIEQPVTAAGWLVGSLAGWAFVLWQCHSRLHMNVSTFDDRPFTRLGTANRITLLRGWLIGATAGFLAITLLEFHTGLLYVPAVLYTLAAALDWLDGHVARRQQQTTRLGAELDTALDAFGLLIAPLVAVFTGKLPAVYLLVSVAYYLFRWGIRWRQRRGRPVYGLPPSQLRRYLAGAQMVLVAVALWPPLPGSVAQWFSIALMIPLLLGFCRDWLHVSGWIGARRESAV